MIRKDSRIRRLPRGLKLLIGIPLLLIAGIAMMAALSGCGSSQVGASDGSGNSAGVKLPAWVTAPGTPKDAAVAYNFALDHPELLSQVPCYCGCGQSAGHKSNLDCFIQSRNGNDVVFDHHGAG